MAKLFEKFSIRGVEFRNRLGVSPMCMYSSVNGYANDWHLVHLGSRAVGGFGLIFAEATAVEARGRITPDDAGLWEDGQIEPLARIMRFCRERGAVSGIQLAHAGRKASTTRPWGHPRPHEPLGVDEGGWRIVGPSAIPFDAGYQAPAELSVEEIGEIVKKFGEAAQRALAAGYEVVEVHGAHGYLLNSFLSPLSNRRTDRYGGSFENRVRMLMEVVREVRRVWPERLALFVRLSCTDWAQGGWTVEDTVAVAKMLKGEGVDVVDCSSGGNVAGAKMQVGPGYQVPFSERVRREAGMMTAAVGLITEARQAEEIVTEGKADVVLLAREALRDAYFAVHAARELGEREAVGMPGQYLRA